MPRGQLTPLQIKYTELVAEGLSEKEAVIEAGYEQEQANQVVHKMRRNARVQERIKMLKTESSDDIMTPQELLVFWSDSLKDPKTSQAQKTEISKLLARAFGMFVEKKEVKTETSSKSVMLIPEIDNWEEMWEKYYKDNIGEH